MHAMATLRSVGNKLRAPELSDAFGDWAADYGEAKALRLALEAQQREVALLNNKEAVRHARGGAPQPPPLVSAPLPRAHRLACVPPFPLCALVRCRPS